MKGLILILEDIIIDDDSSSKHKIPQIAPYVTDMIQDLYNHKIQLFIVSQHSSAMIQELFHPFCLDQALTDYYPISPMDGLSTSFMIFLQEHHLTPDDCLLLTSCKTGISLGKQCSIPILSYLNPSKQSIDSSDAILCLEGFDEIDWLFLHNTYLHAHLLPICIAETDRLLIRELCTEDAAELFELYQDEAFSIGTTPFATTQEEAKKKLDAYMRYMYCFYGFGLWGVFKKDTLELIGHCGMEYKEVILPDGTSETYPELSYAILKSCWHKGYAREACTEILHYAFHELCFNEISIVIENDNLASIRLAKSLGFIEACTIRRPDTALHQPSTYQLYLLHCKS